MDAARRGAAAEDRNVFQLLRALLTDLPGLISDRVQLLNLELQRAARALVQMLALGVAVLVLAGTAWLALWIGLAAALVEWGLPWGWAWAIVLLINGCAAAWAVLRIASLVKYLKLPATMRQLSFAWAEPTAAPAARDDEAMPPPPLPQRDPTTVP